MAVAAVVVLVAFFVTALAAPGSLVDDDSDSEESSQRQGIEVAPTDASEGAPAAESAEAFLDAVAAGDTATVGSTMCAPGQEWQYQEAVANGLDLTLSEPGPDASAPGGILGELVGPDGELLGRITVLPGDTGAWCVESFYVF